MDKTPTEIKCIYPVWITMTSIPERLPNTYKIILNMLKHLKGFDKLVLNIPHNYKNFKMENNSLSTLSKLESIRDSRFILNRTEDHGPVTKLLPTLDIVPEESIILLCDDDCYHLEAFKIAAEAQQLNKSKTFTFWKYNYNNIDIPQGVDIITFWNPNLHNFKRYILNALKNEHCFYVDDQIIGNYLSQNGIAVEQLNRKWKWPWIPNCLGSSKFSLFGQKGEFSRDISNSQCYRYLN